MHKLGRIAPREREIVFGIGAMTAWLFEIDRQTLGQVVPAKAGTHHPWHCWLQKDFRFIAETRFLAVWAPAFAGTTSKMHSRDPLARDDGVAL